MGVKTESERERESEMFVLWLVGVWLVMRVVVVGICGRLINGERVG